MPRDTIGPTKGRPGPRGKKRKPGQSTPHASGTCAAIVARSPARHHESADHYLGIVARLCPRYRVIACKDHLQWILQCRDGERAGRARWTGAGYFVTREALLRASRALCAQIDPAALAALLALPDHFGRAVT